MQLYPLYSSKGEFSFPNNANEMIIFHPEGVRRVESE